MSLPSQEEEGRIEHIQNELYSRNAKLATSHRRGKLSSDVDEEVTKDWQHAPVAEEMPIKKRFSVFPYIFMAAALFFVGALFYAYHTLQGGGNVISSDNIAVSAIGPLTTAGGAVLPLDIRIENKNSAPLLLADLVVDYPSGTKSADDVTKDNLSQRISLGDIAPGEVIQKSVKAVLFGEQNSSKDILVSIEYRLSGSNTIFYKKVPYTVLVNSTPISMTITSLKEINSGQQLDMQVDLVSNSTDVIKNVLFQAAYPFGFAYASSTVQPTQGNNFWNLGDFAPQSKQTIHIIGQMTGQNDEQKVFKYSVGLGSDTNQDAIQTAFLNSEQDVTIQKPFITLDLAFDGDNSDTVVTQPSKTTKVDVTWTNNLPVQVTDAQILLKLSTDFVSKTSISVNKGFYRSLDNTILWDKTTDSDLGALASGESGTVSFTFTTLPGAAINSSIQNRMITFNGTVKGNRLSDSNVPQEIDSAVTKTVKIASDLSLASSATYFSGPFKNTGSLPPVVDKETTYTVTWSVSNSSNAVTGADVSATLPSYVKWLNVVSDPKANITYDSNGGGIDWNIGDVPANTGTGGHPKEISFQVSLLPSVSQLGQAPVLVNSVTLTGKDSFTGSHFTITRNALTTHLTNDPSFSDGEDLVANGTN